MLTAEQLTTIRFIPARDFKSVAPGRKIRLVVIHDMEAPEKPTTAVDVAKYFQHPDSPSSAHYCVDNTEVVRSVLDKDVAYAAPGANRDGIQIELAGYGSQTRGQWMDSYSYDMLALAGEVTAQLCLKYGIPPVHLSNSQLEAGAKGIVGHCQVSAVYNKSDHSDPGPSFPWDWFIGEVVAAITEIKDRG